MIISWGNLLLTAMMMKNNKKIPRCWKFPEDILGDLAAFLDLIRSPIAVRSSSLLEDSQYPPVAGVYQTYMLPNNHPNPLIRLNQLLITIKRVYASTFYQNTKGYIKITSYRLEEEKMAVIVQKMVGHNMKTAFTLIFQVLASLIISILIPLKTGRWNSLCCTWSGKDGSRWR